MVSLGDLRKGESKKCPVCGKTVRKTEAYVGEKR